LAASSNALEENHPHRSFRIIHPFHPLTNREFELVIYRHNWGEDRVYFHDPDGKLSAIPCVSPKLDSPLFSTTSLVFLPTKIFEIKI